MIDPHVPHSREEIAQVPRPLRAPPALRHAVADADDEIIPVQLKTFDRLREERQVEPEMPPREREALDERCRYIPSLKGFERLLAIVYERKYIGAGEDLAQGLQYVFRAPSIEKPIVD